YSNPIQYLNSPGCFHAQTKHFYPHNKQYDVKRYANQLNGEREHHFACSDHTLENYRAEDVKYQNGQDDAQYALGLMEDNHLIVIEDGPDKKFRKQQHGDGCDHGDDKCEDRGSSHDGQYITVFPGTHGIADHGIDRY